MVRAVSNSYRNRAATIPNMDAWKPATIHDVSEIVARDLKCCDAEQLRTFERYATEPFFAPLVRYGKEENVVVVARRDDEVIYYEDVEDGFQISPISSDGRVLEHWCNQDDLQCALNAWIDGRGRSGQPRIRKKHAREDESE